MNELMVWLQGCCSKTDDDINLFVVDGKNYSWRLHEGRDEEMDGLGSKIGPKS